MKEVPGERSKQFIDEAGPGTHEARGLHSGVMPPEHTAHPGGDGLARSCPALCLAGQCSHSQAPKCHACTYPHRDPGVEIELSILLLFSLPSRAKSMAVSHLIIMIIPKYITCNGGPEPYERGRSMETELKTVPYRWSHPGKRIKIKQNKMRKKWS